MHNLAVLLAQGGETGRPDYTAAVEWFRRGAEHGVRDSQFNLAVLLGRGLGTAQDLVQAYAWFAVAALQGDEDAGKKRDEVAGRLSAKDLAAAREAAARFKPRVPEKSANEVAPPAEGWGEPTASAPTLSLPLSTQATLRRAATAGGKTF
jgi:localization factor PodJL